MLGLLRLPLAWRRAREWAPARRDLAALAGFAILFILAMSLFPKKFNRYLVPAFPAIDILAAAGLIGILDFGFAQGRIKKLSTSYRRFIPNWRGGLGGGAASPNLAPPRSQRGVLFGSIISAAGPGGCGVLAPPPK